MEKQESKKWKGESQVEIQNFTPKQIWPLISDFCSLDKWFPHVKTCNLVQGVPGESERWMCNKITSLGNELTTISDIVEFQDFQQHPLRYCLCESTQGEEAQWTTEKLLTMDSTNMSFSYEIVDNNAGFKTYVATVRLETIDGVNGCRIVWSFVADPVDRFTFEDLFAFIHNTAQVMAKRMEESLL